MRLPENISLRKKVREYLKNWAASHNILAVGYFGGDRRTWLRTVLRIKAERLMLLNPTEACQLAAIASATRHLGGDMAEVGVAYGASAALLAEYAGGRCLHLFDTFEGLPQPSEMDHEFRRGQFASNKSSLESVREYLKGKEVAFHKGLFPATVGPVENLRFSFVHLDVDLYQSTLDGLKFFYPRMIDGGAIVAHDYRAAEGVDAAFAEFFKDKPDPVIELSGFQALVIRTAHSTPTCADRSEVLQQKRVADTSFS